MATITQMKMRFPDDFHVHLREGELLEEVFIHTARAFRRALIMPNLKQPITVGLQAREYRDQILRLAEAAGVSFEPLMTIKLTQNTTANDIAGAAGFDVRAVKVYPEGVTTNSDNGVKDIDAIPSDVFRAMADRGLVLCVHAEKPGVFSMDRESAYVQHVEKIAESHPKLKIVLEHVTTEDAVRFVKRAGPNVAATITVHHLFITLDDVVGDRLNPHNFCKPIAKTYDDRTALVAAATSGSPKFFLGTDSAPHVRGTKECASGCAGCFTAPVAMELLAGLFDSKGELHKLEAFTSEHGAKFYGLKPNETQITLVRHTSTIPDVYGAKERLAVVPFKAGEALQWKLA
jgi:dihydroorotase